MSSGGRDPSRRGVMVGATGGLAAALTGAGTNRTYAAREAAAHHGRASRSAMSYAPVKVRAEPRSSARRTQRMSQSAITTRKAKPNSAALKHESNETPPRSLGRILSSRQFWDLMEKWRIPDATSLELIEFAGKLGKNGKRPRFRFTTRQQRITSYLPEIDAALAAAGKDENWLHRQIEQAPFMRRSPIQHMLMRGTVGMSDVLQRLNREAMRAALSR